MRLQIEKLGKVAVTVEQDYWSKDKDYDKLTIVQVKDAYATYISRKPVPAGIEITDRNYWIPFSSLQEEITINYNDFKATTSEELHNIEVLVRTFLESEHSGGVALANELGDSENTGVNQKTITEAINKIWSKFEEITGENLQGISMTVDPSYFIGESECNVHITANTTTTNGIFEHIAFYLGADETGELIGEASNVNEFEANTIISDTSIITCKAKILGVTYTKQETVTHYNSFWLGAGNSYEDVMKVENVRTIENNMRGSYNVNVPQGQHIIIIVGESLRQGFIRADINSVEIPFTEETVTVNGNNYVVFTSVNTYLPYNYNIDING